jgi:hypothetical protein
VTAGLAGAALVTAVLGAAVAFGPTASSAPAVIEVRGAELGGALYAQAAAAPGTTVDACVRVTYRGPAPGVVHLHTPDPVGPLAPHLRMWITPGEQAGDPGPGCAGFRPSPGPHAFAGTLQTWRARHGGADRALRLHPPGRDGWRPGASRVYRLRLVLSDHPAAQGLTTPPHAFVWRAVTAS